MYLAYIKYSLLYYRYAPEDWTAIGKYAAEHDVKAASTYFSRKQGRKISESSVHSIKVTKKKGPYSQSLLAYLECAQKRRVESLDEIAELHPQRRGRTLLLGVQVEEQVQTYLKKIREQGVVVSASIVVAASKGTLLSIDRTQLAEFGGHIHLSREWAYKLLHLMNFVKRKATIAKSKHAPEDFARLKQVFLDEVVGVVEMEEVPPELILN